MSAKKNPMNYFYLYCFYFIHLKIQDNLIKPSTVNLRLLFYPQFNLHFSFTDFMWDAVPMTENTVGVNPALSLHQGSHGLGGNLAKVLTLSAYIIHIDLGNMAMMSLIIRHITQ